MTTQELKQQIDKVLGNSIRCLLPSYWWKRLFNQVVDRIDDKQDALISGRNIKTINGKNILGEGNTDVDIIVGSIEELATLDLPAGSRASVVTGGPVLSSIRDCVESEIPTQWTRISGVKIDSAPVFPEGIDEIVLYFTPYGSSEYESYILVTPTIIGGVDRSTNNIFMLSSNGKDINQSAVDRFNEYLQSGDYRLVLHEGYIEEGGDLIDSFIKFYIYHPTISEVYVKGDSWERLAKESDIQGGEGVEIREIYIGESLTKEQREWNLNTKQLVEQNKCTTIHVLTEPIDGLPAGTVIPQSLYHDDLFFYIAKSIGYNQVIVNIGIDSNGNGLIAKEVGVPDSELSETSTNAVQNKAVYRGLADLAIAVDDLRKDKDKSYVIITASKQSSMTCYDSTNRITTVTLKPNIPTRVYTKRFKVSATSAIESIKLKHLDTSGVKDMSFMFYNGDALDNVSELDLSYFDTSLVTNMNHFVNLPKITKLDVTSFDTSNVTNMDEMFAGCAKLEELDVSLFKTHNVTNMYRVFGGCRELTHLNVSSFDTSKVTTMESMFYNCQKLEEIDVTSFDTSNVTNMDEMFAGCQSLQYLDLSSFDTSNLDNTSRMQNLLYGCNNIQTLILGENFFKVKKEASVGNGLYGKAIYLVLPQWINDSVITSLVNNSYDRISNGLDIITLYLSNNTKSVLTEEHLEIMNAKGYNLR